MKIIITRAFSHSDNGHEIITYPVGENEVSPECARAAVATGHAKAIVAAPENKAIQSTPHNKGR